MHSSRPNFGPSASEGGVVVVGDLVEILVLVLVVVVIVTTAAVGTSGVGPRVVRAVALVGVMGSIELLV